MNYPKNCKQIIQKIVQKFNLQTLAGEKENSLVQTFTQPGVIISGLVVEYKKNKGLTDREIVEYLSERLKISEEKAGKLKEELKNEIFSKMKKSSSTETKKETSQKASPDKYREPIE